MSSRMALVAARLSQITAERDELKSKLAITLGLLRNLPERQVCDCGYDSGPVDAYLSNQSAPIDKNN